MSYVYGVVLVIVGSVGNNLGNNLVSLGHKHHKDKCTSGESSLNKGDSTPAPENSEKISSEKVSESCLSWTNVGRIVFVIGSLFTFASFAFGAQSLIASLESVQFVSNVVFVYYVHHEPITRRMIIATLSIVGGNVLVVVFGEHSAKKFTSDEMIHLYKTNNVYHGYMVLAFILWAITAYAYETYHHSRMRKRILMWQHSFMEPFCYSVSSSIIGTQAVLCSKCLALLLDATSTGAKNEFAFWYVYFLIGAWLLLVAYWLTRLDAGLALFPPCFIIPVMQVFFVFFAIVCGGIYFQEFDHFTAAQFEGFVAGVIMILSGVYGLAPMDMQLYVPGDPNAPEPTKICDPCGGATVHPESVLPLGSLHLALHFGSDCKSAGDELEQMFDGALTKKPPLDATEPVDLYQYSQTPNVDMSDSSLAPTMFDHSNFTRAPKSPGTMKHTRKVVKRPVLELQPLHAATPAVTSAPAQLPPVKTTRRAQTGEEDASSSGVKPEAVEV